MHSFKFQVALGSNVSGHPIKNINGSKAFFHKILILDPWFLKYTQVLGSGQMWYSVQNIYLSCPFLFFVFPNPCACMHCTLKILI